MFVSPCPCAFPLVFHFSYSVIFMNHFILFRIAMDLGPIMKWMKLEHTLDGTPVHVRTHIHTRNHI